MKKRNILGLTTSGHGFSAALCVEGKIVAANSLERLSRKKYDILLPISKTDLNTFGWDDNPAIYKQHIDLPFDLEKDYSEVDFGKLEGFRRLMDHVLNAAGIALDDIDCVAYSYRHNGNVKRFFEERIPGAEFIVPEHHLSHACQAFLPSPFEEAAVMVLDGQGVPMKRTGFDQLSGGLAQGSGNRIETIVEFPVSASLGGLYAEVTRLCGFQTNEEGKTMGLAPYGTPKIYEQVKGEIRLGEGAGLRLRDLKRLFSPGDRPKEKLYSLGNCMGFLQKFEPRQKDEPFSDDHKDLAFMAQQIVEDVMIYLAKWLKEKTGSKNLCIAGGVGLNCVANFKVLDNSGFDNIFVYPSASDNGLAVGQALYVHNLVDGFEREYQTTYDYMGAPYTDTDIRKAVESCREDADVVITEFREMKPLYGTMAQAIETGKITSWWQGRSEFGPRALGNRSILADPRDPDMKDVLNSRVKFRESYRPFTPSVLAERAGEFFELNTPSPFMLLAPGVKPGKENVIPAVTHVDNTARVQTVTRDVNERYYDLIREFEIHTGIPMVLNTSFNIAGEPIVESPQDAVRCFLSTGIDVLGLDRFFIEKRTPE